MDSEMYADFKKAEKGNDLHQVFLPPAKGREKQAKKKDREIEYLEKILSKVEDMDSRILKGVEELIRPTLKESATATLAPEEAVVDARSAATLPALTESVADITQLLSDVELLKKEMEDTDWKHPPADVIDGLISDVRDLKETREKKLEAMALTEGSLEQLENVTKVNLKALRREVEELQKEVSSISTNLGNLFTFVYGKEHGRAMRLKGGWVDDRFVIQAMKLKSSGV